MGRRKTISNKEEGEHDVNITVMIAKASITGNCFFNWMKCDRPKDFFKFMFSGGGPRT